MKRNKYTVLITASGNGKGLGELTRYRNKTLVNIGGKPVISYIIEAYPKDTKFIVTLGHLGDFVKQYLSLAYPERYFSFIAVDKYEGKGSSLGYSMLKASDHLQTQFIYHASDTIVTQHIPSPGNNWIGGFNGEGSSHYASFNILNGKIQKIMEKGIMNPDYLHIGLVGIYDYKNFWSTLRKLYKKNIVGDELGDVHVLNELIQQGIDFKIKEFKNWFDTGNIESLRKAEKMLSNGFYNLDKSKESIYILDKKKVIKFYWDKEIVKQRVKRAKILNKIVPQVTNVTDNFFSYKFMKGILYADVANPHNFEEFLTWSKEKLWNKKKKIDDGTFNQKCFLFYHNKTKDRIKEFLDSREILDSESIINEEHVPSVQELIGKIDFKWLSMGIQSSFHGDFILDNVVKTKKGFRLLDWRENFGGLLDVGDINYDFAKLNHSLIINHNIIANKFFNIEISKQNISLDIMRKERLIECQKVLSNFLIKNGYDKSKMDILTPLIWFNSAPLHTYPYDYFLFYFAKYTLWENIKNAI